MHVARGDAYLGYIHIADQLKPDAIQALSNLRAAGVEKLVMLTGDSTPVAAHIAAQLGLDEFHSELLPEDKVAYMEALRAQLRNGTLVFVGDGINDAPVLAQADVGIAMGGLGRDAAIEAADVVIMDDHPARIPIAISIARRTMAIVRQNIVFALGVKAIVLLMGALGVATMWEAVFADVGVSVIAILNSMRALKIKTVGLQNPNAPPMWGPAMVALARRPTRRRVLLISLSLAYDWARSASCSSVSPLCRAISLRYTTK